MKQSMLLLGILMFAGMLLATAPRTDWQKGGLQGKVKSLRTIYETIKYNPQGFRVSITSGDDSNYNGETNYSYDSANRLLTVIAKNAFHEEIHRITNTYDAAGLLIKTVNKGIEGNESDKFEYNAKKQLSGKKNYYEDGRLFEATEYIYDAAGNKTRENIYNSDMELSEYINYVYDASNKLVEKWEWTVPATEMPDTMYKYNAQGLVTEENAYYMDELESRDKFSYDNYGNVTRNVAESGYSDYTETHTYIYTYDKQGNWLTKEWYSEGDLIEKTERTITYY